MFPSLPLHTSPSGKPLPDPYTTAPGPALYEARSAFAAPAGFCGRVGVLVENRGGTLIACYATEPARRGMLPSYENLTEQMLWPDAKVTDVPDVTLTNGRRQTRSVRAILSDLLNEYPVKPYLQGGKEIEWRKGQLCRAFAESLTSPTVALLTDYNSREHGPLEGIAEWWTGPSPAHEIRFSGTFYAPRATSRFLFDWLIEGTPHEAVRPICDPTNIPEIPVLYEDDEMLVVNKPARLASVPGIREAVNCQSVLEKTHGQLFVVHRLDVDTSGLLAFAKTTDSLTALNNAFRADLVMKRYTARLTGRPEKPRGTVELPLAVNRLDRPRQCVLPVSAGAKKSATLYEVAAEETLPSGEIKTLVHLYPQTGRTHQLRVHCAHRAGLSCPIDGDPFYGMEGLAAEDPHYRLCLHAAELTLPHPKTGGVMHWEAPADFPVW